MRTKVQALRKKQKNTLDQIFKTPVPQGIKWSDIESLVKALGGEIKEGRGSRCKFILNMSVACFHRPHPCNQVNHLIPTRVLVKGGEITCKILK